MWSTFQIRVALCVVFNLAALGCLIPGLIYPLLTISVRFGTLELFRQTRSILGTISYLHEEHADLPALLILVFSVFVPIMKFVLLLMIATWYTNPWRWQLFAFVRNWSKWSMADVFVTATFVAYLSANAAPATMQAQVEKGFYCFLSYCLLSLVALQIMPKIAVGAPPIGEPYDIEIAQQSRPTSPHARKDNHTVAAMKEIKKEEPERERLGSTDLETNELREEREREAEQKTAAYQQADIDYSMLRAKPLNKEVF